MLYIYTVCYNTPQYIEPQYKLLKKFIKNNFEYIVFNNTMTNSALIQSNIDNNAKLNNICQKHNIKVIDLPKHIFNGFSDNNSSGRAGTAINFSHKHLFSNYPLDSTFFLIDTDAFLINDFDVEKFMTNKKMSGRSQYRKGATKTIKYITNHIVIYKPSCFDNSFQKYFSFLPCNIDSVNCDCGGNINYIFEGLEENEFVDWKNSIFSIEGNNKQLFGGSPTEDNDFDYNFLNSLDDKIKKFVLDDTKYLQKKHPFCEIFTNTDNNTMFLHLRAGTNWIGFDFRRREILLRIFFDSILQ